MGEKERRFATPRNGKAPNFDRERAQQNNRSSNSSLPHEWPGSQSRYTQENGYARAVDLRPRFEIRNPVARPKRDTATDQLIALLREYHDDDDADVVLLKGNDFLPGFSPASGQASLECLIEVLEEMNGEGRTRLTNLFQDGGELR